MIYGSSILHGAFCLARQGVVFERETKNFENSSVPAVFCFLSFAQTFLHMEQEEKAQTRMELLMCCLSICYAPLPKSRNLARKAAQRIVDSPNSTFPFPFHGAATNHLAPLESALGGGGPSALPPFAPCVCVMFFGLICAELRSFCVRAMARCADHVLFQQTVSPISAS